MAHPQNIGFASRFTITQSISNGTVATPLVIENLEPVCVFGIQIYNGAGASNIIVDITDADDNIISTVMVPGRQAIVVDIPFHAHNGIKITPKDSGFNIIFAGSTSAIVWHNSPGI